MSKLFQTIGIIGKYSDPRIIETILHLHEFLQEREYAVVVDLKSADLLPLGSVASCKMDLLGGRCDLIIAIGGDGTFLGAARATVQYNIPLIGINLG
ncbi:MAG: NAD(+)/NADH kinase, partial [Methylococcaceae bacterium]